jgi:hypothetical protein
MNTDGLGAYKIYAALKLHFTTDKYDFIKYNGKTNIKPGSYAKRNDRYHFARIAKNYSIAELIPFYVANYVAGKLWIGDFTNEIAVEQKARVQAIEYRFSQELGKLVENSEPKIVFQNKSDEYSKVLTQYFRGNVSIETMCILNKYLNFANKYDIDLEDDVMWQGHRLRIIKYHPFLKYNKVKVIEILKDKLQINS